MKNEKPIFVVKQPVFAVMILVGSVLFIGILTIGFASQKQYDDAKTYLLVTIVLAIPMLISMTYSIKVYENKLIKRFMFMNVVVLSFDEIHSAKFVTDRFGDEWFDIYSDKRKIRMHLYSRNLELLVAWLEKNKVQIT